MRSEIEVDRAVERYSDMIRRICLCHLKNAADTEDVFQTVFLKYLLYEGSFEGPEHERAWFIRVTLNACRDYLKSFFRHRTLPLEELAEEASIPPEQHEVLEAAPAGKVQGRHLPALLRGLLGRGDWPHPGQKGKYGLFALVPGTDNAEGSAGR